MKELKHIKTFESFNDDLLDESFLGMKSRDEKLQKAKAELKDFPQVQSKINQVVAAGERNGNKIPQDQIDELILKFYSQGFRNFGEYREYPVWSKAQGKFIFPGSVSGFIGR